MPIIRKEQRHSKVTLQSYIDTFDELIKVRYIHSVWYDMQVRLSHTIGSLW